MTAKFEPVTENGAVVAIPLNRLKKSPDNARKTPHSAVGIELSSWIAADPRVIIGHG